VFFKRKPRNRRLGREYVLDVKLRSSQVRAARVRMAAVALSVVFSTVLGTFLLWRGGEWALNRLVYENKAFAIEGIEVQTDGVLPVEQLRRWAGIKAGQNLLALDLARVKRDLELGSLVQTASIERILPHTLRIRITEREPIAQVNLPRPRAGGGPDMVGFQLDGEGFVLAPPEPRPRAASGEAGADLPLITGLNPNEIQAGRRVESLKVQAALQLVLAFERSSMNGLVDLKRLDVSAPDVLVVTTGQGAEITFALTGLDQQLRRWQSVFDFAQRTSKAIATLDLAVTNNLPTRWLEASAVAAPLPKLLKPSRKKHV
jgi:cell division septal protein FtsQ